MSPSPNAAVKAASVVGGMLAGADSIDDLDLLRHGGMDRLFAGVRAPSTLGTFLRSFTHGHVQQLDAVGAGLLAGLAGRVPGVIAGADTDQGLAFLDVDDTIREVHGYAKQGAGYGYTRVRGLNIQLATLSTPLAAPVIARARLRKGSTSSAKGAGTDAGPSDHHRPRCWGAGPPAVPGRLGLLRVGVRRCRAPGEGVVLGHRPDDHEGDRRDRRHRRGRLANRSSTRTPSSTRPSSGGSPTPRSPKSGSSRSPAAARPNTCPAGWSCAGSNGSSRSPPTAASNKNCSPPTGTTRSSPTPPSASVEADQLHRDHAIVEQVIAELKDGPLAHLPSGKYAANAAWVALAVIAFNIARAAAVAADLAKARWATLRRKLINVPARIAATGRRLVLHLPTHWPWADAWEALHAVATSPPQPATP